MPHCVTQWAAALNTANVVVSKCSCINYRFDVKILDINTEETGLTVDETKMDNSERYKDKKILYKLVRSSAFQAMERLPQVICVFFLSGLWALPETPNTLS